MDFTHYKHSTIKRRILRRMMLHAGGADWRTMSAICGSTPEEVKSLYEDILINVTSFFREPEAFEALQKLVFPEIVRNRSPDEPIRIWVPGCATGEEAYSIAISLLEFLGDMAANVQIQIFATDIEDGGDRQGPGRHLSGVHRRRTSPRSGCGASSSRSPAATR